MDYSQALQRLANHANATGTALPKGESFLFVLWQAEKQSIAPVLRSSFEDILSCLEVLNHTFNTSRPSDTIEGKAEALPRSLVANVALILSTSWSWYWHWASNEKFSATFHTELASMLVQIGIAWDAVLAGDIDDIREETQAEFSARGYAV